ncbi:MAG: hypothetical protein JNL88_03425 [Bacteroidia bacterium]|nr:hypothetical protein [Bacteroidia bacterium]
MKKIITLFLLTVASLGYAQDVITLSDGRTVQAKILELTPDQVKYKKFDNPDGPTYTVPVGNLTKIKYANGSEDTFTPAPAAATNGNGNSGDNIPKIFKGKLDLEDDETEMYIEAVAKNAGAKLLERCVGKADNQTTEIFWGEILRDDIAYELTIPIQIKWDKGLANKERWIRGAITIDRTGKRTWKYQGDSGGMFFGNCAKGVVEL